MSSVITLAEIGDSELLDRARTIAANLKARAAQADGERRIPEDTITELKAAQLLRLFQPRRFGGREADPRLFLDVQSRLAQQCVSSAWVFGVLSVQSFMLSLFDLRAQEDVWGSDASALASSSFQPMGKAQRVADGFRLSGQWPYSSGCLHAQWAVVGALVPPAAAGAPPEMRLFLVPRSDYEIVDTWNTFGLRGTGSNDLRLDDVFVPEYRTLKPEQGMVPGSTQSPHADSGLYRMPWLYVFTCSVAAIGIGAARGALKVFLESVQTRMTTPTGNIKAGLLETAAQVQYEIDEIEATLHRNTGRLMDCARSGEPMQLAEALQCRLHLTSIVRRCTELVENMMPHLGAKSVFVDHPYTRFWLDLCAARAHPGNDPASVKADLGKLLIENAVR